MVPRTSFIIVLIVSAVVSELIDCDPNDNSCSQIPGSSAPLVPANKTAVPAEIYSTKDKEDMIDAIHVLKGLSKSDENDLKLEELASKDNIKKIKHHELNKDEKAYIRHLTEEVEKELEMDLASIKKIYDRQNIAKEVMEKPKEKTTEGQKSRNGEAVEEERKV